METSDPGLVNLEFRGDLLPLALAGCTHAPDKVFLVETRADFWQVWLLKRDDDHWPKTGMSELNVQYYDPDPSDMPGIPEWLETISRWMRDALQLDRMYTPFLPGWAPLTISEGRAEQPDGKWSRQKAIVKMTIAGCRSCVEPGATMVGMRTSEAIVDRMQRTAPGPLSVDACGNAPFVMSENPAPPPVPMNSKYRSWQDYQEAAAAVFRDLGCTADVDKTVSGARSTHDVDVYVTFRQFGQECRWIVECKLWSKPVTKETVHALRSRAEDLGADRGVIFSESGFQAGARTAAQNTDILLQDSLEEFSKTARFHLRRVPLVLEEADELDAPPVHKFPNHYRPHHLLKHDGRLFVANWGVPQAGNIAIVDPATRLFAPDIATLERIVERWPVAAPDA